MALSILNNIPSLMAQNELQVTNKNLQTTLFRLSSGSRLNSGADDAAGLAIADGLNANITALQQSSRNANDGVGALQVADGALSQVTSLLNRAVTLATEASTGTMSSTQRQALDNEFSHIKTEIDNIGTTTTYNNAAVFSASATQVYLSDGQQSSSISVTTGALSSQLIGLGNYSSGSFSLTSAPAADDTVTIGGSTYTFVTAFTTNAGAQTTANEVMIGVDVGTTLSNLEAAVNGGAGSGLAYSTPTTANASAHVTQVSGSSMTVQALASGAGGDTTVVGASLTNGGGWANGATTLTGGTAGGDITSATNAQGALSAISTAIANVAAVRGTIGATINQLNAAVNVMNTQVQNLTSGESSIKDADIGQEVANLSKYQILNQTGISALAQANTQMQSVLKLLQ